MAHHLQALFNTGQLPFIPPSGLKALAHPEVFAHFTDLVRSSVENKSDLKGLSNIEVFSYFLRQNKFAFEELLADKQLASLVDRDRLYRRYVTAANDLDHAARRADDGRAYLRPDIMQEFAALRTAGVSVGESNCFHLAKAIKRLAIEQQAKGIRFWGKVLGYKDYWVVQGTSSKTYLEEVPEGGEKYGSGVNSYSYWVATDPLGKWTELPLVSAQQVAASRTFKYIFTGELEHGINHSSAFSGSEKHLLKCVVARITHSCELAPKGLYKPTEENPALVDFEEEFKLPEVAELNSLDAWVHLNPHILNQGRCSYYVDPKLTEEQKEALNAELAEKDPLVDRLKGVSEDKPYQALGFTANWSVGISGQSVPVSQVGKLEGTSVVYGVAVLRNLVWPGAVTVGYRGGWTNLYVGYGHRISQPFNTIREVKELQVEAEDRSERPQPNPSKPPQEKKEEVPPAE